MICSLRAGVMALALSAWLAAGGCAPKASDVTADNASSNQAVLAKMTAPSATAPLGRRISNLLDFETANDLTFLTTDPAGAASINSSAAHGGSHSLTLAPGTKSITIKTPALLQGRAFPADWALLGGFVFADRATIVTATYDMGGKSIIARSVSMPGGSWTPVMIDLGALGGVAASDVGTLHLQFQGGGANRIDDVMLIDNLDVVVDTLSEANGWRIRRRGLYYVVEGAGYSFNITTAQAERGGWTATDVCDARVRFTSPSAPGSMTIYADGRMYWGGEFRAVRRGLADAAAQAKQHASPAEIIVPESMGRINRATAGDANNDGYNETSGVYALVASGPRIELTLTPRTAVLSRPVLEIAGLPAGDVRVTMEGLLVPGAIRLPDGNLLVELPGQIARPTLVNVKVK